MDNFILEKTARQFRIYGDFIGADSFGNGHINDTFVSRFNQAGTIVRYAHQKINHRVFSRPDEVMENISRVTRHIAWKNKKEGVPDWSRRSLTVVPAVDGKPWARDSDGSWWRTYLFIENSFTRDTASSPEEARFLGECVGLFQKQLADLPPPRLFETIPDFHDMEKRYLSFRVALNKDALGRVKNAKNEIEFLLNNEKRGSILIDALREGCVPERICHNDTKINNILIDEKSQNALCMVDLDTVMPGTILFDLGDAIRAACNKAAEDEKDLSKVGFDTSFFASLLEGYFSRASAFLIPREIELMAESGRNITQIMATRFLTDYLDGDKYYRILKPEHNLDRCRTQIALIQAMDREWETTLKIVKSLC